MEWGYTINQDEFSSFKNIFDVIKCIEDKLSIQLIILIIIQKENLGQNLL